MTKTVDCRGLECPQPVILTRKAMAETEAVTTIVDNDTAKMNVSRMASKQGYSVEVEEKDDGIHLHLIKDDAVPEEETAPASAEVGPGGPTVVLIPGNGLGRGDGELGHILMRSFLHTLNEVEPLPATLVFINAGVKLTVDGSPVVEDLQALEQRGVVILACGTCLGYFGLKEKIAVGEISNMYTISETLLGAGNVVAL
ncbi:MAG: sulfurtransferase-like selenium metabolism protein YedF [Anaerolineae bacterium]